MWRDSAVSSWLMVSRARGRSLASPTVWVRRGRCLDVRCHMICCWQHIRRRTRLSNRVSPLIEAICNCSPIFAEAALDATAPLEDPEEEDNGPVDSDEETAAVMSALSSWRPQPVVPQPVFQPIRRQYNLARLHEQLHMATNGGRTNIFAVNGFGAQRIPEFVPQPQQVMMPMNMELEDAPGEMDWSMTGLNMGNMGNVTPGGGATGQQGSRQASVTSRA